MRNAVVVLVPLCFGLAFGFIAPSGAREITDDAQDGRNSKHFVYDSARNYRNIFTTKEKLINTETSATTSSIKNTVKDTLITDLYEYTPVKVAELKPRSYIYIKQNCQKPIQNSLYNTSLRLPQNSVKSYLLNMNNVFDELPRQFSIGYIGQHMGTNTESSRTDNFFKEDFNTGNRRSNKSQIYVESLKTPLLRNEFRSNRILNSKKQFRYLMTDPLTASHYLLNPSKFKYIKSEQLRNAGNIKRQVAAKKVQLNETEQQNYTNILPGRKPLLNELMKQKLKEHGGLFMCPDCNQMIMKDMKEKEN